jgi:hypothetical protein
VLHVIERGQISNDHFLTAATRQRDHVVDFNIHWTSSYQLSKIVLT